MSHWLTREHVPLLYLTRYKSNNFQCVSLRRRVCFNMSRHVSPKCVSFWLFTVETLSFSPGIQRGIRYTPQKTQIYQFAGQIRSPADRSDFQFCTTARSKLIIIFTRTVLPCLCFFFSKSTGRNNAMVLFNTLLKITPHDTQKRRSVRSHSVLFQ